MDAFQKSHTVNDRRDEPADHGRVCHTYRQIATILTARDGTRVSPDHVEQMCRTAEAKLARALLCDVRPLPRLRAESIKGRGMQLRTVRSLHGDQGRHRWSGA